MLGGILILVLTGMASYAIINQLKKGYPFIDTSLLLRLFFYHALLFFVYYGYTLLNPSDSKFYYEKVLRDFRGDTWESFYGTSTTFIEFVAYPFIRFMGFSYEAVMALFSWFGYLGFVYFYIFFKENIRFKHAWAGFDMITVFFFLPNLHFWSASLGKGSIIFLALGLYFFGISKLKQRWVAVIVSSMLIYHIRPHIMLVVLLSSAIGFVFSSKGVGLVWRLAFIAGASVAFFFIFQDVLAMVGLNEDEIFTEGLDMSHRAAELSKATSGVDITNYSLPMQLFTFLYRPLFIDAPGALGIFVSFENVFYVLMTLRWLRSWQGFTFIPKANFLVKSAFFSFITVSIALAQVSGNLGIAMRQKSQVMMLLLFVVISFLDDQKMQAYRVTQARKKKMERVRKALELSSAKI
jgi:hypothetical protein